MRTMNITADTDIQTGTRLFALLTCGQDNVCSQHLVNTITGVMFWSYASRLTLYLSFSCLTVSINIL